MSDIDLARDLADYLVDDTGAQRTNGDIPPVLDDERADALLRRIWVAQQAAARIMSTARAEIARIEAWADDRTAGEEALVLRLERALEGWARARCEASGGRTKTITLPNGKISLRAPTPRVIVDDPVAYRSWTDRRASDHEARRTGAAETDGWAETVTVGEPPVKIDRTKIRQLAAAATATDDGRIVLADGEIVPGVHLECETEDRCTVSTARPTSEEA